MINFLSTSINDNDIKKVKKVLKTNWLGKGKEVEILLNNFAKLHNIESTKLVDLANCTDGIFASCKLIRSKFGKNKKVIIPSISFPAVGSALLENELIPLIVGVSKKNLCIQTDKVNEILKTQSNVVAIFINNYGGYNPYIEEIAKICKANEVFLVEDSACSTYAKFNNKTLGTFGDIGLWSFDSMKLISGGDGGIAFIKNQSLKKTFRELTYLGLEDKKQRSGLSSSNLKKNWWEYEIKSYGRRSILNNISASLINNQLKRIKTIILERKKIYDIYQKELSKIPQIIITNPYDQYNQKNFSSYYFYFAYFQQRNKLAKYLKDNNVYTSFRYWPLCNQKIFKNFSYDNDNIKFISNNCLNLPIHNNITHNQQYRIIKLIKKFYY